jgi:hypothetical protein
MIKNVEISIRTADTKEKKDTNRQYYLNVILNAQNSKSKNYRKRNNIAKISDEPEETEKISNLQHYTATNTTTTTTTSTTTTASTTNSTIMQGQQT